MFPDIRYVLGIITTHVATKCIKYLFHMENHIDGVGIVKSVESVSGINPK